MKHITPTHLVYLHTICFLFTYNLLSAQETTIPPAASAEELAKKLANPIANLISLPVQSNLDVGIGAFNGSKLVVNV